MTLNAVFRSCFKPYYLKEGVLTSKYTPPLAVTRIFRSLSSEKNRTPPLDKATFTKERCLSFDEFSKKYGELAKERHLTVTEAYRKMVEGKYNNYLIHQKLIDPGLICYPKKP